MPRNRLAEIFFFFLSAEKWKITQRETKFSQKLVVMKTTTSMKKAKISTKKANQKTPNQFQRRRRRRRWRRLRRREENRIPRATPSNVSGKDTFRNPPTVGASYLFKGGSSCSTAVEHTPAEQNSWGRGFLSHRVLSYQKCILNSCPSRRCNTTDFPLKKFLAVQLEANQA